MNLTDVTYSCGKMQYRSRHATEPEWALSGYIEEAKKIIAAREVVDRDTPRKKYGFDSELDRLRWFPLPNEINERLPHKPAA